MVYIATKWEIHTRKTMHIIERQSGHLHKENYAYYRASNLKFTQEKLCILLRVKHEIYPRTIMYNIAHLKYIIVLVVDRWRQVVNTLHDF